MPEKVATFSANGGPLEVEIVIGQIKRGNFEISLFDRNGENLQVEEDRNGRGISYKYLLEPTLEVLNGALLMWNVIIKAATTQVGQRWSVTLIVTQDGRPIEDGIIPNSGDFEIVTIMDDEMRLRSR